MLQLQLHTYIMMMEWNGDIIVFCVETFNIFGQHILLWLYPSEKRTERERKRVRCAHFFLLFYFPSSPGCLVGVIINLAGWLVFIQKNREIWLLFYSAYIQKLHVYMFIWNDDDDCVILLWMWRRWCSGSGRMTVTAGK